MTRFLKEVRLTFYFYFNCSNIITVSSGVLKLLSRNTSTPSRLIDDDEDDGVDDFFAI